MTALVIFGLSYFGIALGRIPGLALDRVGIALLGAIAMVVTGVISPADAVACIDFPTICLLYALMIISAQLRLGGFYNYTASKTAELLARPRVFLLTLMLVSAILSALLANDIICFAMTPMLVYALKRSGCLPVPFLIGLAVSSNIGSAATLIGNPQNMLIGQVGGLDFMHFFRWAAPPSFMALFAAYLLILLVYRKRMTVETVEMVSDRHPDWPEFDLWQTAKGLFAVVVLVILFLTDLPRDVSALGIAAVLLCSRKMETREILGLVDWHLITLFCALFVIIHGISKGNMPGLLVHDLAEWGFDLRNLSVLTFVSTVLSNVFSNVPAVMLLMGFLETTHSAQWYTLAVSSTFAGNLFLLGSIANLIVVEKAAEQDVRLGFREHAVIGVPVTLVSLLILVGWSLWTS
jgi:Na+/H+ antiporter NhaD/arsenite permease-like protein